MGSGKENNMDKRMKLWSRTYMTYVRHRGWWTKSFYVDRSEELKMGSSLGLEDRVSSHLRGSLGLVLGTLRNHCRFMSRENQSLVKPSIDGQMAALGGCEECVSRGDTAVQRLPGEVFQVLRRGATGD